MQDPLEISHEIKCALNHNEPVVALESSVIAQGLPSPVNVETALAMEAAVREAGAVPATVGIIEGKIRLGLSHDEIERLGKGGAAKASVRDIPYLLSTKVDAGTTVAATMRIAAGAGINVMATGGIGGVHRGFGESFDISADLWELARTPMLVVCSGAKAIVDVAATMEWLETHGVPVYGLETQELPAFYSRSSGISVPKVDGVCELCALAKVTVASLGMRTGMLVAVPVPEADEAGSSAAAIEQAVREGAEKGIKGSALTPYLLKRVSELTDGKSQQANIALLKNNARVAGEIAATLAEDARRRVGFALSSEQPGGCRRIPSK